MPSIQTIEDQTSDSWEDDWALPASEDESLPPEPDEPEQGVPVGIDDMDPGPVLAAILSSIDVDTCSGYDRVVILRAHQRLASHYQAQVYDAMAAVTDHLLMVDEGDVELATAGAVAEVRAALQLTRRAAESEVVLAVDLRQRLPRVWRALASGEIDSRRARVIVDGTCHLPAAEARKIAAEILEDAPHLTTGQLRARLRRMCLEVNPDDATERYQDAVADRHVRLEANDDGSARLHGLNLPAIGQRQRLRTSTASPAASRGLERRAPWTRSAPTSSWTSLKASTPPTTKVGGASFSPPTSPPSRS